jgi:hypothetical protein
MGGRALVGGSAAGRESTGRVVAIEVDMTVVTAEAQPVQVTMCLPSMEVAREIQRPGCGEVKTVVLNTGYQSCAYMYCLWQRKSRAFSLVAKSHKTASCRTNSPRSRPDVFCVVQRPMTSGYNERRNVYLVQYSR